MSRLFPPFMLFGLIILQGINFLFIPSSFEASGFIVTIHGVFVFLIMIGLYYDEETSYYSLLYAIISGLVLDIVYSPVIGVYMFSYSVVMYVVHHLRKVLHVNFYVSSFVFFISMILVDMMIYWIYQLIGVTTLSFQGYLEQRLLMTLAMNYLVFLMQFVLFKRLLVRYSFERFEQK